MAALLTATLTAGVLLWRESGSSRILWNPALGWTAIALLGVTLCMGPVARLWPRARWLLPARREVGVWAGLASLSHVVMVLEEWAGWSLGPLWRRFLGDRFVADGGLVLGNVLGTLALGYALVLILTSNDVTQRRLGPRWSWLQRGATTLFLLAALHTGYFLWLDTARYQPEILARGDLLTGFGWLLLLIVVVVLVVRTVAFWAPRTGRGSGP